MSDPSLSMQASVRARLINASAVTNLVPATNILDQSGLPERLPGIIIGDGQTAYNDFHSVAYLDLHLWTREIGTVQSKQIAEAIRQAIKYPPWSVADHVCHDLRVENCRFLRDPDHQLAHGVVTIRGILQEVAA